MITISERNKEVHVCIGQQTYHSWKKYKEFVYTLKVAIQEGTLWYNLLTREIVLLSESDQKMFEAGNQMVRKYLVEKWFLVPEDVNQKTLVYCFWQSYYGRHPLRRRTLSLVTVFTTTECNARCPYCYEYGTAKNTMIPEIAEQAAEYIARRSGSKLMIKWFGGEPLLNSKAMDIICRRMQGSGIEYTGYVVTNGYLFDRITDEQITGLWKLTQAQITVDGTREIYQKTKMLPDDAYDKVLATIERLARLKVNVMIRLHVTPENTADLRLLVQELSERYSGVGEYRKYLHLYAAPLFENLGKDPVVPTDEVRDRLYDDYIMINEEIAVSGIGHKRGIPKIKRAHCMADNGSSIVITPTGSLTPCEHCHDREIIGNVFDGGAIPDKWLERTPEIPECATCFYYPQCVKLKLCEAESPCNEANRRFMRYQVEKVVMAAYEQYKKRRNENAASARSSRSRTGIPGSR